MTVLKGVRIYRPLGRGDKARDRTARESTNVGQEAEMDSSLNTLLGSSQSGAGDAGWVHWVSLRLDGNCGEGPLGSRDGIWLSKPSLKVIKGRRNFGENVTVKGDACVTGILQENSTSKCFRVRLSHPWLYASQGDKKWWMRERCFNNCDHIRKTGQTGSVLRRWQNSDTVYESEPVEKTNTRLPQSSPSWSGQWISPIIGEVGTTVVTWGRRSGSPEMTAAAHLRGKRCSLSSPLGDGLTVEWPWDSFSSLS